jgi:hypothetical protein
VALLLAALTLLSVALVACSAGVVPNPIANNSQNDLTFSTPNPAQNTPTPTFPDFTIGAWPSNYSPNVNDTITIYVICRVQDRTMQTAPRPPSSAVGVTAQLTGPINNTLHGTTGADGIAAISYVLNDPYVGQPVLVYVSAVWQGHVYRATTFFTTGPTTPNTPTPAPTTTGTPGAGTPTATG